ncbi:MAG: S41 family peptidase [Prevotella sp.]|nr:S41 family peptidase [Prevotella sp.]
MIVSSISNKSGSKLYTQHSKLYTKKSLLTTVWLSLIVCFLPLSHITAQTNHNLEVGKQLDIFSTLYSQLDLFYVDSLRPDQSMTAAIRGLLRSLDPYTEYYSEQEQRQLEMMLTGKYAGIGALVKYHQRLHRVVIDEPYAGMPAAEAGLKKGDIIVSIDDSLMTDKDVSFVSSHLRGDPGTTFQLRILRPSTNREMTFTITRRNIKMPDMPYYGMRSDSIGYINLSQFTEDCSKEVRRAFVELRQQGARGLIFDLRSNGGGSEMEAVNTVNIWVPQDQMVVENRGKVAQASHAYSTRLEPVDTVMPIVVLVNDETASASEITSGALQDLDRAVIMGTRTYGKGLVQVPIELPYHASAKITTSKYYIPSGRCIQAINYTREGGAASREHIPDSLTHLFYTRGGRPVRDGGGIKPDVEVKNDTMPNIAYYLSASGLDSTEVMFDYVVDYIARHDAIAAPTEFHLTDQDWAEFREKVISSGFTYDQLSRKHFNDLVQAARFEGYYDQAREDFDALEQCLNHDVATELDRNREVIQQMIELEIIGAYYFQAGTLEAGLDYDKQMLEAERLLKTPDEYNRILHPQP